MNQLVKIVLLCILSLGVLFSSGDIFAACEYSEGTSIVNDLEGCINTTSVVHVSDVNLDGGFKNEIFDWVKSIAIMLGILAVGSIVYGALLMTLSTGDDEKIKKAKDVVKWGMLGFLGVISASSIIAIVVNIMYSI